MSCTILHSPSSSLVGIIPRRTRLLSRVRIYTLIDNNNLRDVLQIRIIQVTHHQRPNSQRSVWFDSDYILHPTSKTKVYRTSSTYIWLYKPHITYQILIINLKWSRQTITCVVSSSINTIKKRKLADTLPDQTKKPTNIHPLTWYN